MFLKVIVFSSLKVTTTWLLRPNSTSCSEDRKCDFRTARSWDEGKKPLRHWILDTPLRQQVWHYRDIKALCVSGPHKSTSDSSECAATFSKKFCKKYYSYDIILYYFCCTLVSDLKMNLGWGRNHVEYGQFKMCKKKKDNNEKKTHSL